MKHSSNMTSGLQAALPQPTGRTETGVRSTPITDIQALTACKRSVLESLVGWSRAGEWMFR